jgi:hypothetical protein
MCKVLTAKHFIIENFWNSNSKMNIKMNEIEYLKTLKVLLFFFTLIFSLELKIEGIFYFRL